MHTRTALDRLADTLGVARSYIDGLGRTVEVPPETLIAICRAMGLPIEGPDDAPDALAYLEVRRATASRVPPVIVAWEGVFPPLPLGTLAPVRAHIDCEHGERIDLEALAGTLGLRGARLPVGAHTLHLELGGSARSGVSPSQEPLSARVLSVPRLGWRPARSRRRWGVATHVAALRSRRSGAIGDLDDLESVARAVAAGGGDIVTALPLLPTFNTPPAEPSPYSPVSRLFWSELLLGGAPAPAAAATPVSRLDVTRAAAEVRALLADEPDPEPGDLDPELVRYARFRGAQVVLGRDWRQWPAEARAGTLRDEQIDADEARFHRIAQHRAAHRTERLRSTFDELGIALGLDLAVGVHPDGYDPWAHPHLFAEGMSVGAPPDPGFPSGQDWGFAPLLPEASRLEGHRYLARTIAHQAAVAGVLRIDHIMSLSRLYWVPHGIDLNCGTYVRYPLDELLAVLVLESHRHRCELVGENLGTVPPEIDEALPRHGIKGMRLALFEAGSPVPTPPSASEVAMINTHDTPTFVGWIEGRDIDARVESGLLAAEVAPAEREARRASVERLARAVGAGLVQPPATDAPAGDHDSEVHGAPDALGAGVVVDPADFLDRVLEWLARSDSPMLIVWLEDLWAEADQVNLPGTASSVRPNWQRPMAGWLEDLLADPRVRDRFQLIDGSR